ncbi:MAG: hypothetical protein ACJATI_004939 [Halioglobus sp.]
MFKKTTSITLIRSAVISESSPEDIGLKKYGFPVDG